MKSEFLWGTATSSHQIEGGNFNNDWYRAEKSCQVPKCGVAANSWLRWKDDVKAMKSLGTNAYRFSIEWSRVMPKMGQIDESAIAHYRRMLVELHKNKIKTCVTLWHFTNPIWFVEKGGWERRENIKYFLEYVKAVVEKLGRYVDFWTILNEPNLWALISYQQGYFPPFKKSLNLALRVQSNLADAHNKAYNIVKQSLPKSKLGIALSANLLEVKKKTLKNILVNQFVDWVMHFRFMHKIRYNLDFLGLNYYYRIFTDQQRLPMDPDEMTRQLLLTGRAKGSSIFSKGLYEVIKKFSKYNLPIYITENGIGFGSDKVRIDYLKRHLFWLKKARGDFDVRGYFYWSLLDNYEWRLGYRAKFGLFKVSKNFDRVPRKLAKYYAKVIKKGLK